MDKTLLIWKYLLPLLNSNEDFSNLVDEKYVYPLAALADTPFPYVIYKRDTCIPVYTKQFPGYSGWTNNIQITISVYSDNYDEAITIANIIRDILENYNTETEEIKIHPIELISSSEYYSENGFVENLTFSLTAE